MVSKPSVARKKITAAFDGGVMLLSLAERRRGIVGTLAALIDDQRDPARTTHTIEDVLRARIFAIACGYWVRQTLQAWTRSKTSPTPGVGLGLSVSNRNGW